MNDLMAGAAAGTVATAPMTAVMEAAHQLFPSAERQPIPPRQITMWAAEQVDVHDDMDESDRTAATMVNHFAYGAGCGAVYGLIAPHLPGPPIAKGIGFGLAVWAGSYLGWLPAMGVLPPATREPAGRNIMMIGSHIVWGAATGLLTETLRDR